MSTKYAVLCGTQTVTDPEVAYVSWARANQLFRLAEQTGYDVHVEQVPQELAEARLRAAMGVHHED